MSSFRRQVTLRRLIADIIVDFTEDEADEVLRAHGFAQTDHGWGRTSPVARHASLLSILINDGGRIDELATDLDLTDDDPAGAALVAPSESTLAPDRSLDSSNGPIFVVHGHNHTLLHLAVRVLERSTNRNVIVLHEQVNAGRTILEKFEQHAITASFAVVLLTGDDEGRAADAASSTRRGRQNVIFELGFFFGKLGRERVAVLLEPSVEKPSDIDGLVYIAVDSAGAWKRELGRELEAANILVNYSQMP